MNFRQKLGMGIAKMFNLNVLPGTEHDEDKTLEWLGIERSKNKPTADITYFTCLKMMSETVAKMPWKFYQNTVKGIKEPKDTDVSILLKHRPNPYMTPTIFWNTVEMNRNHYGNAYVYVQRQFDRKKYGGQYRTLGLWIMPSDCVQVIIDDAGYFGTDNGVWYWYTDRYSGQQYIFKNNEVLHFKTSHTLNGITGLPVQYVLKETVDGALEAQKFLNNLYKNGLTAKATLEYTGTLEKSKIEKMREIIERFGAGSGNSGRVLPIPDGMKLTPLNVKLSDSQFVELKKYSALQIAAAFGIKPNQINDYSKSSYSNSEMQQLSFYAVLPSGRYSISAGKFSRVTGEAEKYNGAYQTEWEFLKDVLMKNGVPENAVLREDEATFTWQNALFSRKVTDQAGLKVKKAILCCKNYHARRAFMYYQRAYPETEFLVCPCSVDEITKENWKLTQHGIDEVLAEIKRIVSQFQIMMQK